MDSERVKECFELTMMCVFQTLFLVKRYFGTDFVLYDFDFGSKKGMIIFSEKIAIIFVVHGKPAIHKINRD